MRPRRMTSKKSSVCIECQKPITPGQSIFWARGRGAWHVDCQNAALIDSQCPACSGKGCDWKGTPCKRCDGTGAKVDLHEHPRTDGGRGLVSQFVPDPVDMAYEDDCARRCGL
jgi:hypothetical protein